MTIKRNHKKPETGMTFPPEEARTKQGIKAGNIGDMMRKYTQAHDLVPISASLAMYGDFSEVGDFQTALDQVRAGQDAFMALPSAVRSMHDNEPAQFIEWIENPDNREEAIELKLLDPDPVTPGPVVVTLQPPEGIPDGEGE